MKYLFTIRMWVLNAWRSMLSTLLWERVFNALYIRFIEEALPVGKPYVDTGARYYCRYPHLFAYGEDMEHDTSYIEWFIFIIHDQLGEYYYIDVLPQYTWALVMPRISYAYRHSFRSGRGVRAFLAYFTTYHH